MANSDQSLTQLECKGCGERHLMRTRQIFNPELYVRAAEKFANEHKDCAKFPTRAKAKAALVWRRLCNLMDAPAAARRRARA